MRYILHRLTVILFLLITAISCKQDKKEIAENPVIPSKDSVRNKLQQSFQKNGLMGLSVQLLHDKKPVLTEHFGFARLEDSIKVSDSTIFRIASISKTFTALALMKLVEEGKADLDTDVNTYLGWSLRNPSFPDTPITLRMLMSHQSSIRDATAYSNFAGDMVSRKLSLRELFHPDGKYYSKELFANHEPGTFFSYANSSWGIIASIIEILSKERFDIYCQKILFKPMNMDARFEPASLKHPERLATLYRYKDSIWIPQADDEKDIPFTPRATEEYTPGHNGLLYGPQGSLRCSLKDLTTLIQLFLNEGKHRDSVLFKPETLAMMNAAEWRYDGSNGDTWDGFFHSYGLGLHVIENRENADVIFPDRTMAGHPGIAYGLLSDMYFDTRTGTGVIFITNGSKTSYAYGKTTTFYQPEEDVFNILNTYLKTLN